MLSLVRASRGATVSLAYRFQRHDQIQSRVFDYQCHYSIVFESRSKYANTRPYMSTFATLGPINISSLIYRIKIRKLRRMHVWVSTMLIDPNAYTAKIMIVSYRHQMTKTDHSNATDNDCSVLPESKCPSTKELLQMFRLIQSAIVEKLSFHLLPECQAGNARTLECTIQRKESYPKSGA